MRRFGIAAALIAGLASTPVMADADADLTFIADALVSEAVIDGIMVALWPGTEAMFRAPIKTPHGEIQFSRSAQKQIIPRFRAAMIEAVHAELRGILVQSYRAEVSPAAISAFAEFLRTPEGQEYVTAQPRILERSQKLGGELGLKIAQDIFPEIFADLIRSGEKLFDAETEFRLRQWLRGRGEQDL
ncbi:MAG: DUF2059 domain-containing protein [Pseudomonadota bacterium]